MIEPEHTTLDHIAAVAAAGKTDRLVAVGEIIDLEFTDKKNLLSLRASKLFHLLVSQAGVKASDFVQHKMTVSELNSSFHMTRDEFFDTVSELVRCEVRLSYRTETRFVEKVGPLLADVERDRIEWLERFPDEPINLSEIRWEFSPIVRMVLKSSRHWADLSRKAVLAFESKYAVRLYEMLALRQGLKFKYREEMTLEQLRARLGVPEGKMTAWSDFRRFVLELSLAQIDQLSGLKASFVPVKTGKKVTGIILKWHMRDAKGLAAVEHELENSRVGRRARRDGSAETVVSPLPELSAEVTRLKRAAVAHLTRHKMTWPSDDRISDWETPELHRIGRDFGGGHSVDRLAASYAQFMGEKRFELRDDRLAQSWQGFCEQKARDWIRP